MSSAGAKRKRVPTKKAAAAKKRKEESEESDLSDGSEGLAEQDEVLIAEDADLHDEPEQLPKQLLDNLIQPTGQLIYFGSINFETCGKRDPKGIKMYPNIYYPNRFGDWKVRLAVSGPNSAHNILVDGEGKTYTFGRNQHGQLGLDHTNSVLKPTLVPGLEKLNVISAATGRHHTLFLTDTGTVYACGMNNSGQCGVGNSQAQILTPTRINYRGAPIVKIGCGAEFSIILDIKGALHTFGLPEYGQLGHNTDGKYFITSSKMTFNFVTSPKRVVLYIEKSKDGHVAPVEVTEIVDFSCGSNHTVAIDSKKRAFSWGFGGFGRLGHAEQKDEMVPRLIKYFDSQSRGIRQVCCGSTFSLALTEHNGLFLFGQTKRTGEANMYPKPIQDLAGWNIHHMAAGFTSIVVAADETVIAWGASPTYGELGFGDLQKSSTNPKEVNKLIGCKVLGLSLGYFHTMIICAEDTPEQKAKLETIKKFEPPQ